MKKTVRNWFVISLLIGGFVSLLASSHPDGFEKAGEETGYIEHAASNLNSPFPDYTIPGWDSWFSNSIAGLIGVSLTFGLYLWLGKWITGRNRSR